MSSTERDDLALATACLVVNQQLLPPAEGLQIVLDLERGNLTVAEMVEVVGETTFVAALAKEFGHEFADLFGAAARWQIDSPVMTRAEQAFLMSVVAVPLRDHNGQPVIAAADPADLRLRDFIRVNYVGSAPRVVMAGVRQIYARLDQSFPSARSTLEVNEQDPGSAVTVWLDRVFDQAARDGASDLHFSTNANGTLLFRRRVDGMLQAQVAPQEMITRPAEVVRNLLSRCGDGVDVTNHRQPQSGAFQFVHSGRGIDVRLEALPQIHGSGVVCRLLDPRKLDVSLDMMGFAPAHLEEMYRASARTQGLVLVVGPTGSGKSTTLYSLVKAIDPMQRNILTAENPVEYRLPYVGQTEVRLDLGDKTLGFGQILRSHLRMDPDVLFVGEIRDADTARTAIDAAITGHLVMSTLHTDNALASVARLQELGVDGSVVSRALSLVVSQRLLRMVHGECAQEDGLTDDECAQMRAWGWSGPLPATVARPVGCPKCAGTGYRGRLAVAELFTPTRELRAELASGYHASRVEQLLASQGHQSIFADGARHVAERSTSIQEVLRVLGTGELQ